MPFSKIPTDLKERRQWALSGENKAPLSTNGSGVFNISVIDPTYLLTFEEAVHYSKIHNLNFGFILSKDDPFTCIDLDVIDEESQTRKLQPIDPSKWTTKEHLDRYWSIVQNLKSYTEHSKYGKGIHVWVRGNIGSGMRRDGIEVYSQERYMICTGNTLLNNPIAEAQSFLDNMQLQMKPQVVKTGLEELPQEMSDDAIIELATNAANKDKFNALCNGEFPDYPSQSEADLALMSMFTFYSPSNEQCRRLFRFSALGQRDKAVKNDTYLNCTLRVIRTREQGTAKIDLSQIAIAADLVMELQGFKKQSEFLHSSSNTNDNRYDKPPSIAFAEKFTNIDEIDSSGDPDDLEYPPGFAGVIARYIYNSAPRPVKEVAIVAALGLMAGICGKAFSITQSGLNMYIILVARSGIGKEALHSGISSLMTAATSRDPICMRFINFTEFASGPALIKTVVDNNSFVNVAGEWGRKLTRLAKDDGRDSAMHSLRTVMTDLYQKSGPQSIVGGLTYSSKDNNVASISGVAYSMIGESTPGTFYECLTPSMMSDGFLSRFNIVEYLGERPPLNLNQIREPDKVLGDSLAELCSHCASMINRSENTSVQRSSEAARIIAEFELECDTQINSSEDESWRQMWNRAALKVIKLAALLAVGDNFMFPIIQEYHLNWALKLVRKDIGLMEHRMASGEIGINDNARERKLLNVMKKYLMEQPSAGYKVIEAMRTNSLVSRKYLQMKICNCPPFEKYQYGSGKALDSTIKSLCDSGYIVEMSSAETSTAYNFHGKSYRILDVSNIK
ncbi:hypothetical protein UFOVP1516_26 [uncultured Caudovirales phage]|uniref:DUF3987 domain-containing protein n=1 Tax=uncultured Caudovirales phage TaxID=2100421 RepID=A0A6J7X7Y5_9CAUD|nr:hypothetical protein UFOVP887_18 [uncultured Caudovirales phage]CAB5226788.1 hypothetical protein UFOVP1516_26 [uncultured Caudovirales phage]